MIDKFSIATGGHRGLSTKLGLMLATSGYYVNQIIDVVYVSPQIKIDGDNTVYGGYSQNVSDIKNLLKPKDYEEINQIFTNLDKEKTEDEEITLILQTFIQSWHSSSV